MSDCKHPLWERIRLCDEGACPDCLAARLAAAERELDAERAAGAALAGRLGEVQAKADCAERDRDEFDRQRKLYHSDMMAVREQRDAAERRAEEAERALGRVRSTIEATFGRAPTPGSVAFDLLRTVDFALRSPGDHTEDGT